MTSRWRPASRRSSPPRSTPSIDFAGLHLGIPILASAMDAVVDVRFAGELARLGGVAVLNLEGVQARYDDPDARAGAHRRARPTTRSRRSSPRRTRRPSATSWSSGASRSCRRPVRRSVLSATPAVARRFGPLCAEHGADLFLVQSQVSSARHIAAGYDPLELSEFTRSMGIPVAVGNTTSYDAAYQLMGQGIAAIFVGVGPGAACTTRDVLGIGVPQVTAIADVAAARDAFFDDTGRYVPVVADGGMRRGGELAKAIAAGADALMIGSPLARAAEAPGRGTNWGMAAPSPTLPRGTRIKVGTVGSLERILFGPSHVTDGTENLVGALRQSMAALGARDIRAMQAGRDRLRAGGRRRGQVLAARPLRPRGRSGSARSGAPSGSGADGRARARSGRRATGAPVDGAASCASARWPPRRVAKSGCDDRHAVDDHGRRRLDAQRGRRLHRLGLDLGVQRARGGHLEPAMKAPCPGRRPGPWPSAGRA